ncbi:MAG: inorganic phosphate transporter [Kiritimatiellae bacterium]|nr:inorganic phosphate transporter [Kiritimatiellia bacterium]
MDPATLLIILALVFGFYMAWTIGANDVANAFGTVVGSGAVTFFKAVVIAAIFEFCGAYFAGSHVADTIKSGIVAPKVFEGDALMFARGMLAALLAAAIWLHVATCLGQPVSTTHAIIGAVIGFGLFARGPSAIQWGKMGRIAASWFVSPIVGGILAFLIYLAIRRFVLNSSSPARRARTVAPLATALIVMLMLSAALPALARGRASEWVVLVLRWKFLILLAVGSAIFFYIRRRLSALLTDDDHRDAQLATVEKWFSRVQILTACNMAFAHGANDVANAIGPIAGILSASHGTFSAQTQVPPWLLAFGGFGIVMGLATYGYRVIESIGKKITEITPSRGLSAEIGTATTVLVCSLLGLPISTTFVLVGAVMGVGFARGFGAIDLRVIRKIFASWLVTIPVSALLAIVIYLLMAWLWPIAP